jgi:hypothetical protein
MTSLVKDLSDGVRLIQLMVRLRFPSCAPFTNCQRLPGNHGYVIASPLVLQNRRPITRRGYFSWSLQQKPAHARPESREREQSIRVHHVSRYQVD